MKNLRTIILAAGKGTRMKSSLPKVLHPVCGRPIISYVLDVAKAVGSLKNYVVLGHQSDKVQKQLGDDFVAVLQKTQNGTADAVRSAESHFKSFNGHVLIMCGDTPLLTKETMRAIVKKQEKSGAACTFLTAVVHDPSGYGRIIRDEATKVVAIREDKDAVGFEKNIAEINVGVYCFKAKELFKGLKEIKLNAKKREFYLTDIIELFRSKDLAVETIETDDPSEGLGINSRVELAEAQSIIRKRIIEKLMLDGVTVVDPLTTHIDADVKIGQDTTIFPFSVIERDVKIGKNCLIGPFARLRPGTKLADNVEVGNFTEVSRTRIGSGTFMKHFSFLGDAIIGNDVNIGAGTITANFDGVDKNITRVGDKSFIGSDSVLIAPVKVGKNAVVGAGTVLPKNKNVPDNGLAKGVPAEVTTRRKRT